MTSKFSIRYKILTVIGVLLIMCVGMYLMMATKVFKDDKTEFVFEYNKSLVKNISSEISTFFSSIEDKLKLTAIFTRQQNKFKKQTIKDLYVNSPEIVFVANSFDYKNRHEILHKNNKIMTEEYATDSDYISKVLEKQKPVPFDVIKLHGMAIWNATVEEGPPLIGFGKTVKEMDYKGEAIRQYVIYVYVKANKLFKLLKQGQHNQISISTRSGEALTQSVSSNVDDVFGPILTRAKEQDLSLSVLKYEFNKKSYLGAYAQSFKNHVIVASTVAEEKAFMAVQQLIKRSFNFALIVITATFIVAILFSASLTKPLNLLVNRMKKVSDGDLDSQIVLETNDEIESLAGSFNEMITDLRQSRMKLEEMNRNLEDKVKQRTAQLEERNVAIKEAQEALVKSTKLAAVGEVAGQAAHEVLNPLTAIISRVNKINKDIETQKTQVLPVLRDIKSAWEQDYSKGGFESLISSWQKTSNINKEQTLWQEDMENLSHLYNTIEQKLKYFNDESNVVLSECERISRIVNSMRSMSVMKGQVKRHSLHELTSKSIKIMEDLAAQSGIEITIKKLAERDIVLINDDEYLQVLTNLLRNAVQSIKSMQKAKGKIEVSTILDENTINVVIEDDGAGIPKEVQGKLFEKYFTTKGEDEGTGIGLSLSRRLIRAFKGDLFLKNSSENNGAIFVVQLPLAEKETGRKVA